MDKNLRLFAAAIISESKLSKAARLQLINFVKEEASDAQVKALLMDGKIVQLDEQGEEIVNDRFEGTQINEALITEGPVGSIMGMLIFSPLLWAAWRALGGVLSKKRRQCGTFRISTERDKCLERVEIQNIKDKIAIVEKAMRECSKNKDPKACMEKGNAVKQKLLAKVAEKEKKFKLRWGSAKTD